jgi:hypothetical protein
MRVHLDQRWVDRLLRWPEAGMGYQRVDLRFSNGRELHDVRVFNAADVDLPDEFAHLQITTIEPHR